MRPYLAIVLITHEQASSLDVALGLKTRMPAGWRFDRDCIFDCLHKAGIALYAPGGARSLPALSRVPSARIENGRLLRVGSCRDTIPR